MSLKFINPKAHFRGETDYRQYRWLTFVEDLHGPDALLGTLYTLTHLILTTVERGCRYFYFPHFLKAEGDRGFVQSSITY